MFIKLRISRSIVASIILVTGSFSGVSQAAAQSTQSPTRVEQGAITGGTLRVALRRLHEYNLLPWDNGWIGLFSNQFESLVKVDENLKAYPSLATSWEISPDGKTYTFHLKRGVEFQDGDKFDANAVKTQFDALYGGKLARVEDFANGDLRQLKSVDVLDQYTVQFSLNNPDAAFLTNISSVKGSIASPSSVNALKKTDLGESLKGTGPFELVQVDPDQQLVYKRFDKYNWAPGNAKHDGPAYLEKVVLQKIPDPAVRAGLLTSGQVDLIESVDFNDIPLFRDNKSYQFVSVPEGGVPWVWYFNADGFGTNDIRVREAIREALDVDSLVKNIYQDTAKHAWSHIPSTSNFYNAELEGKYTNNVKKANDLLDEAGWTGRNSDGIRTNAKGEPLELVFLNRGLPGRNKYFAEAVQQSLRDNAGIKLTFDNVDSAQGFAKRKENKYSIFHTSVSGYDQGISFVYLFSSTGVMNFTKVSDPALDDLLQKQAQATSPEERARTLQAIDRYVVLDKKLVLPVTEFENNVAATSKLHNVDTSFIAKRRYVGPNAYDLWIE
ncbi:ABC transporter substrate-binding protein [Agrobacterium tumefaciens]|nr:ABC transporter substrate-binding protein [Agrobacterium tumefaciens]